MSAVDCHVMTLQTVYEIDAFGMLYFRPVMTYSIQLSQLTSEPITGNHNLYACLRNVTITQFPCLTSPLPVALYLDESSHHATQRYAAYKEARAWQAFSIRRSRDWRMAVDVVYSNFVKCIRTSIK